MIRYLAAASAVAALAACSAGPPGPAFQNDHARVTGFSCGYDDVHDPSHGLLYWRGEVTNLGPAAAFLTVYVIPVDAAGHPLGPSGPGAAAAQVAAGGAEHVGNMLDVTMTSSAVGCRVADVSVTG